MAKVLYEFDSHEDRSELSTFQAARDMFDALIDVDQMIRTRLKYSDGLFQGEIDFLDRLREVTCVVNDIGVQ